MNWINSEKHRKFGITFSVLFLILSALFFWRGGGAAEYFFYFSAIFFFFAAFYPRGLKSVESGWMKFAESLMWFNTRLILGIIFFLVFAPFGLLMRLFGKNPVAIKEISGSYWQLREKSTFTKEDYERIF